MFSSTVQCVVGGLLNAVRRRMVPGFGSFLSMRHAALLQKPVSEKRYKGRSEGEQKQFVQELQDMFTKMLEEREEASSGKAKNK